MKKGYIVGALLAALLSGYVVFVKDCDRKKQDAQAWKENPLSRSLKIIQTVTPVLTPNGTKVYFEAGTDPSVFSLPAADAGIEKTFRKAECAGYAVERDRQQNRSIIVFNSEPDSQGDPAFRVYIRAGTDYYDSEWDKEQGKGLNVDHYILVAGQTILYGEPYGDVIIIPHHSGKEAHLSTVVEYEFEHVELAWYDGPRYEDTKIHGSGQGHPILADCP